MAITCYVFNRPVNQLSIQATDAVALANGIGQSASSKLSSVRTQEAGFRFAQSAAYNESVGRWETRGTSQERTEGWSKSVSGSHATQGGEGFTFNHAAEITASFERVSDARAHGGEDVGGRFAIGRQSGGRNTGTPATMQCGANQVQQAAGVTAEEAKHVIEARSKRQLRAAADHELPAPAAKWAPRPNVSRPAPMIATVPVSSDWYPCNDFLHAIALR